MLPSRPSASLRIAVPTPVGARYSPNAWRNARPHSPVVTPALAQAIEGGMMLAPLFAALRKSSSVAATALASRAGAPGRESRDLVGLGLR